MNDYESYDALGLAELIRKGEAKPSEILEAAIARLEERNPKLNAVVIPMIDEAREAAGGDLPDGPFRGVPFLLKDLHLLSTGSRTSFGCRLFEDFVADHDSEIVTRYREGGAGDLRKDRLSRIRPHHHHGVDALRTDAKPLEHRPHRRRLFGRSLGSRRCGDRAPGQRQRWRWLDPHPRLLLRSVRNEAHPRPHARRSGRG